MQFGNAEKIFISHTADLSCHDFIELHETRSLGRVRVHIWWRCSYLCRSISMRIDLHLVPGHDAVQIPIVWHVYQLPCDNGLHWWPSNCCVVWQVEVVLLGNFQIVYKRCLPGIIYQGEKCCLQQLDDDQGSLDLNDGYSKSGQIHFTYLGNPITLLSDKNFNENKIS